LIRGKDTTETTWTTSTARGYREGGGGGGGGGAERGVSAFDPFFFLVDAEVSQGLHG